MKKIIALAQFVLLIISASIFPQASAYNAKFTQTIQYTTNNTQINISYPKNLGSKIDAMVLHYIQTSLYNFKKEIGTQRYSPNWKNELDIQYTLKNVNDEILVIQFSHYQFTGGAHGTQSTKIFNFSLSPRKNLSLSDIFGKNALNKISQKTQKHFLNELKEHKIDSDKEWIIEGTKASYENFDTFEITKITQKNNKKVYHVMFYLKDYQIAPHSQGILTLEIKSDEI